MSKPSWVRTNFVYPPIPVRQFDWNAVDSRSYSGDSSDPIGTGATEQEAVDDLMDKICMARGGDVDHNNGCAACSAEAGISCRAYEAKP